MADNKGKVVSTNQKLEVSEKQAFKLELHSFLNLFSVVYSQLDVIREMTNEHELLDPLCHRIKEFLEAVDEADHEKISAVELKQFNQELWGALLQIEKRSPKLLEDEEYTTYRATFERILEVLTRRIEEYQQRTENFDSWEKYRIEDFKESFFSFFDAVEKHSGGRYRIIYNVAKQHERDYLVHFEANSDNGEYIFIPILIKDVIRDLLANARKYTDPGGTIKFGVYQSVEKLRFVIEDNGVGIPEDELHRVTEYGYRASNIKGKRRTLGAGVGLTKAAYVIQKFNGEMEIESKPEEGTRISVIVPVPEDIGDVNSNTIPIRFSRNQDS